MSKYHQGFTKFLRNHLTHEIYDYFYKPNSCDRQRRTLKWDEASDLSNKDFEMAHKKLTGAWAGSDQCSNQPLSSVICQGQDRKSKLLRDIWSRNGYSQRAAGKCQNARGPLRTAVGKKVLWPWPLQEWSSHSWQAATAADREQKTRHAQRLTRMASFSKIHSRSDKSKTLRTSNYFIN